MQFMNNALLTNFIYTDGENIDKYNQLAMILSGIEWRMKVFKEMKALLTMQQYRQFTYTNDDLSKLIYYNINVSTVPLFSFDSVTENRNTISSNDVKLIVASHSAIKRMKYRSYLNLNEIIVG